MSYVIWIVGGFIGCFAGACLFNNTDCVENFQSHIPMTNQKYHPVSHGGKNSDSDSDDDIEKGMSVEMITGRSSSTSYYRDEVYLSD